ncbi:MAG: DNA polymerase III subunit gamma/tau [Chlamydiae bacterium]|nr:DNA polymerase III subunit gamma/tau [Chlamydiota bacterium]
MEKYQILARKYRPQTFKEVIGQTAIITTIKNSLKYKRVAHAYLFSGSRGTGKTTLARLFAKALNCKNLSEELEPCNNCQSCLEISASRSLDVIEIDGASNRGIDDIRQINETIGYAPTDGKYKIYIIDEVHMLTKEAFNALLKTLEEPPSNIKFFFATTEAHKVLPTIISRCQRFELNRILIDSMVSKLETICIDLNRKVQKEALYLIANFSDGSLRDSESLLDQILCYHDGEIAINTINELLGFISEDYFFTLDEAFNNNNINFAFSFVEKIFSSGKDFAYILESLLEHYRHILLFKIKSLTGPLSEHLIQKYKQSCNIYTTDDCLFILDLLITALQNIHKSPFKRVFMEMCILKIIQSKNRIPIQALAKKLIELEKEIKHGNEPIVKASQDLPKPEIVEFLLPQTPPPIIAKPDLPPVEKRDLPKLDNLLRFAKVELKGSFKNEKV